MNYLFVFSYSRPQIDYYQIQYLMIPSEEIANYQNQVLKSHGPKLINYGTKVNNLSSAKQNLLIFRQFIMSKFSQKQNKMLLRQVRQVIDSTNANLQALAIILFKIVFEKQDNDDILYQIKSRLYSQKVDLKTVKGVGKTNFTQSLQNKQMKTLMAQFFDCLKYSNVVGKVQASVKNCPIALQIFVIFFRTILALSNVKQALNYQCSVNTETAFETILQVFDIYYTKKHNMYFFNDDGYFIQCGYKDTHDKQINEFLFGSYFQNQRSYRESIQELKQSIELIQSKKYEVEQKQEVNQKQKYNQKQKINPFHLIVPPKIQGDESKSSKNSSNKYNFINSSRSKSSLFLQELYSNSNCDNPTPSFNELSQQQISFAMKEGNAFQANLKTSETNFSCSVKNKILKSSILEDTIPQSQLNKNQQSSSMKVLLKGSAIISPKSSNNLCKIHNSDKNIQIFDSPATTSSQQQQSQLRFRKFSQYNQNNVGHVPLSEEQKKIMKRSQSQKNSIIIKQQTQSQQKKGLFGINCRQLKKSIQFQQFFQFGSERLKKPQHSFTGDNSYYSCTCSVFKSKKNKIQSNVLQISLKPQFNFKKKGLFQHNQKQIDQSKQKLQLIKKTSNLSFLNNIQARKLQLYRRKNYSANKSQNKTKSNVKNQMPMIKYSQFIMPNRLSKTPQKSNQGRSISPKPKIYFSYKSNQVKQEKSYNFNGNKNNKIFTVNSKKFKDSIIINSTSSLGLNENIRQTKIKR